MQSRGNILIRRLDKVDYRQICFLPAASHVAPVLLVKYDVYSGFADHMYVDLIALNAFYRQTYAKKNPKNIEFRSKEPTREVDILQHRLNCKQTQLPNNSETREKWIDRLNLIDKGQINSYELRRIGRRRKQAEEKKNIRTWHLNSPRKNKRRKKTRKIYSATDGDMGVCQPAGLGVTF